MSTDVSPPRESTDWPAMLAAIEDELRPWRARSAEPPAAADEPAAALPSEVFAQRLEKLEEYLAQAERNAEQALAPLTAEIEALEEWLRTLNTARGKLVERTAGGV